MDFIDLNKKQAEENLIDLSKKAETIVLRKGLGNQKARVALVLDASYSMEGLYKKGVVQRTAERLLALAMQFDDNGEAEVFVFGENNYEAEPISSSNFYEYVDKEIYKKYGLESSTQYAGVIKRIAKKYYPQADLSELGKSQKFLQNLQPKGLLGRIFGKPEEDQTSLDRGIKSTDDPVFVLFITDGDNFDKDSAEKAIRAASHMGIFWQFVGVGRANFNFLEHLDNMDGRYLDNANFFQLNDLSRISDDELYERILNEFPSWLQLAKNKKLIG